MKAILSIIAVLLASQSLWAQSRNPAETKKKPTSGVRYQTWIAGLDGDVRSDRPAVEGSEVDFTGDLDIDQNEIFHDLSGWVEIPEFGTLRFGWWFGEFSGSDTLGQTVTFEGSSFTAGSSIESTISIHHVSALYEMELWGPETLGREADILFQVGLKYVSTSTKLETPTLQQEGKVTAPLPVVGIRGEIEFSDKFSGAAQLNGLIAPLGDSTIRLFDFSIEVAATPGTNFNGGLGYHVVSAFAENEESADEKQRADLLLSGFYLFVGWDW